MTNPPTGPQHPGSAPEPPQYGAPQYGAPQYGGAPQPGYPAAPQAYGSAPWSNQRPGSGTAAGVLGIIFTVFGFFSGAMSVIALTGAAEMSAFAVLGVDGFPLVLLVIASIALLAASVVGFLGAIQLLSGKSNQMLLLGTYIFIGSRVLSLIAGLMVTDGEGAGQQMVSALIGIVLAVVLVVLARGADVTRWLEQKKAQQAAGYY